jgi:hypothetical protein
MKKLSTSAYGAATSTLVTTPRPKLSTSYISALEHRQKFAKQSNRSWRGSIIAIGDREYATVAVIHDSITDSVPISNQGDHHGQPRPARPRF